MPLDQVENFVEVNVSGTHSSTETTISLQSGEASNLPDPSSGEFNLVWFDSTNFSRPSEDNSVEIVRVTGRDITNDTITVLRGQENTTAVAHDTANSDYVLILAQTAKMIEDVDAADFSTNSLTVAGNNVTLGQSTAVDYIDLNDTGSSFPIPNTDLSNSSVSIAGNSVSLGGSTNVNYVDLNDTGSSFPIPNSDLGNSSLTVAGNLVSLGGSTAVATGDLSDQNISTPSAGQTILYDATAGEFVNGFISAGTALGSTSGDGVFTLNVQEGNISHDNLSGYVANEHIDHSTVSVSAGTHLTGGGDLTASRTLNVDETTIDATNLDGSAGTSGQLLQTDGSALSFTDLTVREIQQLINNQAVIREDLARNNFEDNLGDLNYQGGFFDIFADTSKVESSSNVTISTLADGDNNGKVQLKLSGNGSLKVKDFDGFESGSFNDGNPVSWNFHSTSGGSATVQNSIVAQGNEAVELTGGFNENSWLTYDRSSESKISDGDTFIAFIRDGGGNPRFELSNTFQDFNGNDSIKAGLVLGNFELVTRDSNGSALDDVSGASSNVDQWYRVEVEVNPSSSSVTARFFNLNGDKLETLTANTTGENDHNFIHLFAKTGTNYFDTVSYGSKDVFNPALSFSKDGFIVEREDLSTGDDNFSNPPVSITVNQDADIPPDEDIEYIVKDVNGSGTDTTVTQSKVGTSVDISDFTGLLVEVKTKYTTSDGADTPTHRSQDFYFEEG